MDNKSKYKSVIFTSDLFKVDDREIAKASNPQSINVEWVYELFSPIFKSLFNAPVKYITGDERGSSLNRILIYKHFGLPFNSASWASLYSEFSDTEYFLDKFNSEFSNSLVIGYELPPSHIKILEQLDIDYIDLTMHPYRFLPNYIFGIRTNIDYVFTSLSKLQIPNEILEEEVRITKSRSVRVWQNRPAAGSALFIGQIEIDSSLIDGGNIVKDDLIADALHSLSIGHDNIYYKFHPHRKDKHSIEKIIRSIPNCSLIEVNIYDAIAANEFVTIASLSSGALHEAKLFGNNILRHIKNDLFEINGLTDKEIFEKRKYITSPNNIVSYVFWEYLFDDSVEFSPVFLRTIDWLKFSLNMRWGR